MVTIRPPQDLSTQRLRRVPLPHLGHELVHSLLEASAFQRPRLGLHRGRALHLAREGSHVVPDCHDVLIDQGLADRWKMAIDVTDLPEAEILLLRCCRTSLTSLNLTSQSLHSYIFPRFAFPAWFSLWRRELDAWVVWYPQSSHMLGNLLHARNLIHMAFTLHVTSEVPAIRRRIPAHFTALFLRVYTRRAFKSFASNSRLPPPPSSNQKQVRRGHSSRRGSSFDELLWQFSPIARQMLGVPHSVMDGARAGVLREMRGAVEPAILLAHEMEHGEFFESLKILRGACGRESRERP